MRNIWVISDTHFGHENIYKFVGQDGITRVRPQFEHASQADEFMLDRWNELVKPEDHIYHLGDVAMNFAPWVRRIKSLPGHKRLILGNHDKGKTTEYLAAGFEKIMGTRTWDRKIVILSHYPLHEDSVPHANVHGHIHERVLADKRYINVSVEQTNYQPVSLEEIIDKVKKWK